MAVLTVQQGLSTAEEFFLQDHESVAVSLGRDPTSQICLEDQSASRRHARIDFVGDHFKIVDLKSSNGTFVNGEKIEESILEDGDVITIGQTTFVFEAFKDSEFAPAEVENVPAADGAQPETTLKKGAPGSLDLSEPRDEGSNGENFLELAVELESLEFDRQAADQTSALEKERKKLKTIYKVSEVIGTRLNRDQLMEDIMDCIFDVFPQADRGFLMLRDDANTNVVNTKAVRTRGSSKENQQDLSVSRTVVGLALNEGKAILSSDAIHDERFASGQSVFNLQIRSLACVPMVHAGECIGVIQMDTMDQSKKFVQDDLSLLQGIARQAAIAIKNSKLLEAIENETAKRTSLQRFLSPSLVEKVMNEEIDLKLGGDIKRGTIFFSDIIGFTKMSSKKSPEDVVAVINRYFNKMVGIIFEYEGMINKFGGDSIMALWGLEDKGPEFNPHAHAVEAAVRMQASVFDFNYSLMNEGQDPIWMGIGLNTGEFVAGNIGSREQMEYTVIGDEVNLSSRIESKAAQGMVYISESTYAEVEDSTLAIKMAPIQLKGVSAPTTMYSVRGVSAIRNDSRHQSIYLALPASLVQDGNERRGFIPRCNIDESGTVFELHTKDPCNAEETLMLKPYLHEMPDVPPLVVKVLSVVEARSENTAFHMVQVELTEENDFVTRFLLDKETLESPIDPGDITRG
jgi:adenylate cyclase